MPQSDQGGGERGEEKKEGGNDYIIETETA